MSYNTFNPIVYKGLVLYLDAENLKSYSSGLNWYDITSNGNNGVLTNGATFSLSGNSIQFDGIDDYISCGNSSTFQINSSTLCVWLKTTNPGNGYRAVITKQSNYGLFLLDGVLITYDWGDGTYGTARSTGINLTDGKWHHVVLSFINNNIMSPSNNANIYINGINVLTTTIKYLNDSQEVQIASGGSIGGSQYLNGDIASVQIYNRVISSEEVLQNYNATKWRFINE